MAQTMNIFNCLFELCRACQDGLASSLIPHFICCANAASSSIRLCKRSNLAYSSKVSKDGQDGRPPMQSSLPAALDLQKWTHCYPFFAMMNLSPLCLSLKSLWRQWLAFQSSKAVTVWTVLSLRGWSSWSSSEGSSRKVFFTMALLQDEPWPCCSWRGWWMMDDGGTMHRHASYLQRMDCSNTFVSTWPQSSDSA